MLRYIMRSERKNNWPSLCRARVYTCKDVWEFTRDLTTKFNNACVWNSKFRRQTDGDDSSNYVFQLHIDLKAFNSPLIYSVHAAIERDTCGGKHCRHCSAVGNWVCSADIKTNFLEVSWRETIIVSWNGLVYYCLPRITNGIVPKCDLDQTIPIPTTLFALFHGYCAINDYYLQFF